MAIKFFIVLALLAIFGSLFSALVYMIRDKGESPRMLHSLMWRIGLSIGLFVLLFIAYSAGLIRPHGVYPQPPPAAPAGTPP